MFNSLLDGAAKQSRLEVCEQVIKDMVEAGISPSNHSASILIKLHGRRRDVDAAFQVINELPAKYGFRPNAAVFTCLMATCIQCGRLADALQLRERMLQAKCQPDDKTYSTLLRGALRASSADCCIKIIQAAIQQGPVRQLLDADLIKSVFDLLQRKRLWDQCGQELQDQLQDLGSTLSSFSTHGGGDQRRSARGGQRRSSRRTTM